MKDLLEEGVYERSTVMEAIRTKKPFVGALGGNVDMKVYSNSVPILDEMGNVTMVVTSNMSAKHNLEWERIINEDRIENTRLKRELDYHRLQDQRVLVANSPVMKNIMTTIEAIAPTEYSVVILGESGTGKDMIAQMIHETRPRELKVIVNVRIRGWCVYRRH